MPAEKLVAEQDQRPWELLARNPASSVGISMHDGHANVSIGTVAHLDTYKNDVQRSKDVRELKSRFNTMTMERTVELRTVVAILTAGQAPGASVCKVYVDSALRFALVFPARESCVINLDLWYLPSFMGVLEAEILDVYGEVLGKERGDDVPNSFLNRTAWVERLSCKLGLHMLLPDGTEATGPLSWRRCACGKRKKLARYDSAPHYRNTD